MVEDTINENRNEKWVRTTTATIVILKPLLVNSAETTRGVHFTIWSSFKLSILEAEEPMPNSALNLTSLESCIIYAYVITQFSIISNHCKYVNRNKEYHLHLL